MPDIANLSSRYGLFCFTWEWVSRKKDNNASKYLVFQRTTIYIILEHHFIGGKKVNALMLSDWGKNNTQKGVRPAQKVISNLRPLCTVYIKRAIQ